jgi:hypothetical protein
MKQLPCFWPLCCSFSMPRRTPKPRCDFDLIVRANGKELLRKPVSKATATADPWLTQEADLFSFAGKKLKLKLVNQPSGWKFKAAYWAEIAIVSQ